MVKTLHFGEHHDPVPGFGAMGLSFGLTSAPKGNRTSMHFLGYGSKDKYFGSHGTLNNNTQRS